MGVLTGIVTNIADQEIGATKIDPRLLHAAEFWVLRSIAPGRQERK